MPEQPSHVQLTEITRETIPMLNWMIEDLFCRYGRNIPFFLLDFSFSDYSDRPDWISYTPPDWYLPEWKAMWPTYASQWGFPEFSGFNFNVQWGQWDYWLASFNELLGLLFDAANLPRWQMPDLSEVSIDMLNTKLGELYDDGVFAEHYVWTQTDAGGILQLWTGLDSPALGFTATKRTSGSDYANINDPGICVHSGKVYMAYAHDEYSGVTWAPKLYTAVMDEDGTNFAETSRRTFPNKKSWDAQHTQIHALDSTVYVAWLETISTKIQLFTAIMGTDGSGWSATQRSTEATNKTDLDMQIYNNMIYVLYVDWTGTPSKPRLNIAFMELDGSNWEVLRRYTYTGLGSYARAKMHIVDNTIYLFWRETSTDYHYDYLYLATRYVGYERLTITDKSAAFTIRETITGADSGATAIVEAELGDTYLDISGRSETAFTDGEEIEGGTSGSTATMTSSDEGGWSKSTLDTIDHWAYHDPVNMTWTVYHTMYVEGNFVHLAWMQAQGTYPNQVNALWTGRCNTDKTGFTSTRREYNAAKSYYTLEMKVSNNLIYYITLYYAAGTGPICTATMNTDGTNFTLTARTNTTDTRADVNMAI